MTSPKATSAALAESKHVCSCDGCWACNGHENDCTCDVDWDALTEKERSRG